MKLITARFNIHGLVKVFVKTKSKSIMENIMHQLAEFQTDNHDDTIDILIQDYSESPRTFNSTTISDYYCYEDNWLDIPAHRACFNLCATQISLYCDRMLLPINLLIHLALLRKDASLIHSAAVEYNGKHFLCPAFGGIGKTTLVAAVAFAGGRLYGDDMIIIKDNKILKYPQDFSVYPYHVPLLRLNDPNITRKFGQTKLLTRITDILDEYNFLPIKALKYVFNYLKVPCVNIAPRQIFGENGLASSGVADRVYYLERMNTTNADLVISRCDPKNLAERSANILLQEWHQSMQYLYTYSALSSFSLIEMYNQTLSIFNHFFTNCPCYTIEIPRTMSNELYQDKVLAIFGEVI